MAFLWVWASLAGAFLQTLRNAMQSGLTAKIGTIGATQVRFLFGLPFAAAFLGVAAGVSGEPIPLPDLETFGFALMGGLAQIAATAFMLYVMKTNGFAISTAWLKGEPVIVALIGWAVLGDPLSWPMVAAIAIAVAGVLILSLKPGTGARLGEFGPAGLGLLAGALFGLSAIGFRGAITALEEGSFLIRALSVLVLTLTLQSLVMLVWTALFDRRALLGAFEAWRPSILAGFFGAAASAGWFLAFSLASAAHVRTLALTEVIFAMLVARFYLRQSLKARQLLGIAVLMLGVIALLWV